MVKKVQSFIVAICLLLGLVACGAAGGDWQAQYDLGVRYLSEGNYEEAVLAFEAAIEIAPKEEKLYLGLADAYIGLGDYEKATNAIQAGRKACGESAAFDRLAENLSFLQAGGMGIRITDFYFDKESYCAGNATEFVVSVAYRCPENEECILMIGANTHEPNRYRMLNEDFAVTGSGGYQFSVSVTPHQWEDALFGIYVNLSEADHAYSWTPFGYDVLNIDPAGNVVSF